MQTPQQKHVNRSDPTSPLLAASPQAASSRTKRQPRKSDVTQIYGGVASIYRTTHSGDVYQFQMWISEEGKYVRRSLKTRDKEIAIDRAQAEFIRYKAKIQNGEKVFSLLASELREKYLEYVQTLVNTKQISDGRASNIRTYTKHWLSFVGKETRIHDVDRKKHREYLQWRQSRVKNITTTVVVNESITIKQMYKWAIDSGFVTQKHFPDYGPMKAEKNEVRREGYALPDYIRLTEVAKFWYNEIKPTSPKAEEEIYYRRSVRDFIVLMARYGFRTGELLLTKFKDVKIHDGEEFATVYIPAENTKVRVARTVIGRRGDVFARRIKYCKHHDPEDYVFSHYVRRGKTMRDPLYEYYNLLKDAVKAKYSDFDDTKDLYSLRHFWITMQLQVAKVDIHKIARYAGTSIIQIQRHYDNVKDRDISAQINAYKIKFDEKNNDFLIDND